MGKMSRRGAARPDNGVFRVVQCVMHSESVALRPPCPSQRRGCHSGLNRPVTTVIGATDTISRRRYATTLEDAHIHPMTVTTPADPEVPPVENRGGA